VRKTANCIYGAFGTTIPTTNSVGYWKFLILNLPLYVSTPAPAIAVTVLENNRGLEDISMKCVDCPISSRCAEIDVENICPYEIYEQVCDIVREIELDISIASNLEYSNEQGCD
jgi:hypothetical protein